MADPTANPLPERRDRPLVLVPLVDDGDGDLVTDALAAVGAGATGVELRFGDAERALRNGLAIADQLADLTGLAVFLRSDVSIAADRHITICPPTGSSRSQCVVDLGIDRLGTSADSSEVAARWPELPESGAPIDPPFMVATAGFSHLSDAELMALTTIATVRGATAISTDRARIVRRVVDTVAEVLAARVVATNGERGSS